MSPRKYAATTVTQSRVSIFAASKRKRGYVETVMVKNGWGFAEVTGDLTQIHRTILDVIIASDGERFSRRVTDRGELEVAFPPHALLRILGHDHPGARDFKWLEEMIDDLRTVRFRATINRNGLVLHKNVGIITAHGRARRGEFEIGYGVQISSEYMAYYSADIPCHTENLTHKIAAIPSGAVQAAVRLLLTHKNDGTVNFSKLLDMINVVGNDRRKRARADFRKNAALLESEFGISVGTSKVIGYRRHRDVHSGKPDAPQKRQFPNR